MKVLVAEDDKTSRVSLERALPNWGYEVTAVANGEEALAVLRQPDAPRIALLDWMMPRADGIEVCRQIRAEQPMGSIYIILLTARTSRADIVTGLESGADDYLTKPYEWSELRARIKVGVRIVELQEKLSSRVRELEEALGRVRQLEGLLPICSYCKKIRDDKNYWHKVEQYLSARSAVMFSHSICPDCWTSIVVPEMARHGIEAPPTLPK